ncbi:hypothetical protein FQN60_002658, partial [Etheostoma spectabile]
QSGGFYSAEDADSVPASGGTEKREGSFCVWTASEVRELLPDDPHGELQGQNVLIVRYSVELTAARFGISVEKANEVLASARTKMAEVRNSRPRPHLDTKMLASWNETPPLITCPPLQHFEDLAVQSPGFDTLHKRGVEGKREQGMDTERRSLMLSAYASVGAVLGDKALLERAVQAGNFLKEHLWDAERQTIIRSCYRGDDMEVQQIEACHRSSSPWLASPQPDDMLRHVLSSVGGPVVSFQLMSQPLSVRLGKIGHDMTTSPPQSLKAVMRFISSKASCCFQPLNHQPAPLPQHTTIWLPVTVCPPALTQMGSPPISGFLDDYAFIICGLLDLYEANQQPEWLQWAEELQLRQDQLFWDEQGGGGYFCSDPNQDGAEPSANSVSASNLLRLSHYAGRQEWLQRSQQLLAAFSDRLTRVPIALPEMVQALMAQHYTLKQIVICGQRDAPDTTSLLAAVNSLFLPH